MAEQFESNDLQFIISDESLENSNRIQNLLRIVDDYERETMSNLWRNLRQTLQRDEDIQHDIEQKLQSFITGVGNIYNVFARLLKQQNYIGLMTQVSVKQICRNLSNKAEAQWMLFYRSISKSHIQQANQISSRRNRKNQKISLKANITLQKWLLHNFSHPYPCSQIKGKLAKKASLSIHQVNNWFTNARERGLKKLRKGKEDKSNTDSEDDL